ncbi:MAG: FAD-binding protein [Planctomycetaceae bacterium]|nr:FAD-binding protein [Planctomycetaceae bacterium]
MDEIRGQVVEDLTDLLEGEIRADAPALAIYSTDASLYEIQPLAVAFPAHRGDVERLAAYSADHQIPLIPRGSGSGLAGGCLGAGIVVDFARHMNSIVSVGTSTVRVQTGVRRKDLNDHLRKLGLTFAPDPSNSQVATIGGMLGVDAAGSHAVRVGSTRDHVKSLECVLSGGQCIEFSRSQVQADAVTQQSLVGVHGTRSGLSGSVDDPGPGLNESLRLSSLTPATRRLEIQERLSALLLEHDALIRQAQPLMLRNTSGYMLRGVRDGMTLDFPRLLTGSEGTLALFTEATLHTMPLPAHRAVALYMFGAMEQAVHAMQLILPLEPSACDLLDRRILSLGRNADEQLRSFISADAEAGLIVEFPGHTDREVKQRLADARRLVSDSGIGFVVSREAYELEDADLIWSLAARVVPILAGLRGASRPLPFVEDVAVPPDRLAEFLVTAQRVFQKHEVTATLYSHAASGQLHFRPILPQPTRDDPGRLEAIARDLYRQAIAVGGTISGEHGDGLSRTAFVRTQYGPLYRVFQQVKQLFDPLGVMNPDKILSNDPQLTIRHLRRHRDTSQDVTAPPAPSTSRVRLQLAWSVDECLDAASRCNGCAICKAIQPAGRMCPMMLDEADEQLSPRAKASLVRSMVLERTPSELLAEAEALPILDSCFNCRQCQLECPSEVSIPQLLLEARAQRVAAVGLTRRDRLMSRIHRYAPVLSRAAFLTNWLLRNALVRRILERSTGLAARRRLPRFARKPFLEGRRVQSENNSGAPGAVRPTVTYFVDYFANHHDPELAEAFCRVMEHNGFRVYIPPAQTVSGMSMISVGDLAPARVLAETNIRELVESAREGYPIVCTEPSAALCLAEEYPLLINSDDVRIVAQHAVDAGNFLKDLQIRGRLRTDFQAVPHTFVYHTPCHVRALTHRRRGSLESPWLELLKLIPELNVVAVEKGCTGMAGTYGLPAENFEQSLRIGSELIQTLSTMNASAGATDCSSCRMQMEQSGGRATLHPMKLLALAYGLMPQLASRINARPGGLVMS